MPFWSPDSRFIGFNAGGQLRKVAVTGGPPIALTAVVGNNQGAWNQEDVILFSPLQGLEGLFRIPAAGGAPVRVTALDTEAGDNAHWNTFFLPDGRHFLYFAVGSNAGGARDARAVMIGSLDPDEPPRLLLHGGANAKYAMGYVLFMRDDTLMAQPFDADRLELTGEGVPIVESVLLGGTTGKTGAFSVSQAGVLAYQQAAFAGTRSQLAWFDRSGSQLEVLGDPDDYSDAELDPGGTRVVVGIRAPLGDLWIHDMTRGIRARLTFDPAGERSGVWSPDGRRIVFDSNRRALGDLFVKASNGAGSDESLLADRTPKYATSWSPDGRYVLYARSTTTTGVGVGGDLMILPMFGNRTPIQFLVTPFNETQGQFSPDGRWVAYASDESGRFEIYIRAFAGVDDGGSSRTLRGAAGQWQVSSGGGLAPRWRGDGRELYYLAPDNRLMAVPVSATGSAVELGAARALFQTRARTDQRFPYDVTADGQRFLVNTQYQEQATPTPITLVTNWPALLRR